MQRRSISFLYARAAVDIPNQKDSLLELSSICITRECLLPPCLCSKSLLSANSQSKATGLLFRISL